ncbi:NADH-quinone oxidoreductase subunit M [Candidatus Sumerlaeota bacterium]|nr:NADH-quinone oxidoreductase subunit M [Candidatus Sumerlaeota bacterium]
MPLLSLIIFAPIAITLVGAIFSPPKQMRLVALVSMLVGLALTLFAACTQFDWSGNHTAIVQVYGDSAQSSFQLRESIQWLSDFKISYIVGADNLSMLMVILTAVLGVFGVLCSWKAIDRREKEFYIYLLLLQTGIMGTFLALDMFLFYMFWELMLIPLYFMIGIWGSANRLYATMKFVLYTLVGSVLMLIAIIWMYFNNGATVDGVDTLTRTYSYEVMLATQQGSAAATFHHALWPFLALFLAFAIKVPLFPLHTWLPDAHTEAPTAGSVILAGVLLKTGGYGIIRFCLPLFPEAAVSFAPAITWLAVIAIIYGAWTAIVQTDIKRLVAYSSVSHMGFVILGIFSMNPQGMAGAVLQMINHGISTSGLFLAIGMLYERAHTREMSKFGGLAHTMPVYAALMLVMVLSSVGLPGLNGFLGEFTVLLGSMHNVPMLLDAQNPVSFAAYMNMTHYTWLVAGLATTGVIFGAVYLLILYQKTFFGKPAGAHDDHSHDAHHGDSHGHGGSYPDLSIREWGQLAVLGVAALFIGLYPKPVWKAIAPATRDALAPVATTLDKRIAELPNPGVKLASIQSETRLAAK